MIEDIRPRDIRQRDMALAAEARATGSAAHAIRPTQPGRFHTMSDAELADAHRGQSFALERAKGEIAGIEAELDRRQLTQAKGKLALAVRRENAGLIDLPRLRAEMGEAFCRRFAKPGSGAFWRSRTLAKDERPTDERPCGGARHD